MKTATGEKLKRARNQLNLTQAALAEPLGMPWDSIRDIETGRKKLSTDLAVLIEKVHGINLRWLLTGEGDMFINKIPATQNFNAIADNNSTAVAGFGNNIQTPPPIWNIRTNSNNKDTSGTQTNISVNVLSNIFFHINLGMRELYDILAAEFSDARNGFFEKIRAFFPSIPVQLALWKACNVHAILDKLRGVLGKRGIQEEEIRPVGNQISAELMEHGSLVEDEIIQDMWANLLANAMDPNFDPSYICPPYINILNNLTSLDVFILDKFSELDRQIEQMAADDNEKHGLGMYAYLKDDDEVMVDFNKAIRAELEATWLSIDSLGRLGLINTSSIRISGGTPMGVPVNPKPARKIEFRYPYVTEFGRGFLRACTEKTPTAR
jgi:DNA-binding XRE family transcriptional regulator